MIVYSRTYTFVVMVVSGLLFQAGKALLGFPITPAAYLDSIYWAAGTLLVHWSITRKRHVT